MIREYLIPASSYRSIPINTSRQFRAVVVNPGGSHSSPFDNSNISWSITSYVPEIMRCIRYQLGMQNSLHRRENVDVGREQDINEQLSSALNIPLTKYLDLNDIGPHSDISRWLIRQPNNIWAFDSQKAKEMQFANTKFIVQNGFCELTEKQSQKINDYIKEKYSSSPLIPLTIGGIPISFNGDEILKINDTGLVQAGTKEGYAKVVAQVKNNNQIREVSFDIKAIPWPASSVIKVSNPDWYSGIVHICGNAKHIDFSISSGADPIWIIENTKGALSNPGPAWAFKIKQDLALKNSIRVYVKPNLPKDGLIGVSAFSLSQPNFKSDIFFKYSQICTPGCSKSSFLQFLPPYLAALYHYFICPPINWFGNIFKN